ncbi:hypothetical protein [Algoriphagus boritolerans]|uniref:hypothetical protein n=1 Tax=Algoriphagus boritolerans TaxID=308111 RepID=UPI002FCDE7AB
MISPISNPQKKISEHTGSPHGFGDDGWQYKDAGTYHDIDDIGREPHTPTSRFNPSWLVFILILKRAAQTVFSLKVDLAGD